MLVHVVLLTSLVCCLLVVIGKFECSVISCGAGLHATSIRFSDNELSQVKTHRCPVFGAARAASHGAPLSAKIRRVSIVF